jgi:hypothetical protein
MLDFLDGFIARRFDQQVFHVMFSRETVAIDHIIQ